MHADFLSSLYFSRGRMKGCIQNNGPRISKTMENERMHADFLSSLYFSRGRMKGCIQNNGPRIFC